jgi:hypothetical protein
MNAYGFKKEDIVAYSRHYQNIPGELVLYFSELI